MLHQLCNTDSTLNPLYPVPPDELSLSAVWAECPDLYLSSREIVKTRAHKECVDITSQSETCRAPLSGKLEQELSHINHAHRRQKRSSACFDLLKALPVERYLKAHPTVTSEPEAQKARLIPKRKASQGRYALVSGLAFVVAAAGMTRVRRDTAVRTSRLNPINSSLKSRQPFKRPHISPSPDDTLVTLAESHFFDARIAWLIANLNRCVTRQHLIGDRLVVEMRTGQDLVLPSEDDLCRFYQDNQCPVAPEKIVTVIAENLVDLDFLQDELASWLTSQEKLAIQRLPSPDKKLAQTSSPCCF